MGSGVPPRVVASGNAAAPLQALDIVDRVVERYRLNMLNAPHGVPARGSHVRWS